MKKLLKLIRKPLPSCAAIVVAAGSSQRMQGIDKLTAPLGGEPLLLWSLRALEASEHIHSIYLVAAPNRIAEFAALAATAQIRKLRQVLAGGASRTESVRAGLDALPSDIQLVAIHDAARPLVSPALIDRTIRAAAQNGAAAPGLPVKDTIKRCEGDCAVETPDRATLTAIQTPQCFDCDLLRGALRKAQQDGAALTDDCSALERLGMRIRVVPGEERNFKVTTPLDLRLAELLAGEDSL